MFKLKIDQLFPHPDNPRKDLGDLTELAESIKVRGIMQNLTVVPRDEDYNEFTVIIGHRRLAAAKLAGLIEVPCSIVELDVREQLATMLLENMQRSDLTIYEQAQGFQMMLDLGSDVSEIAKETGLSKTTIKNRTKLLAFDRDSLKAAEERGGTLSDYLEVLKISDEGVRNEVLAKVGTNNFDWELKRAIREEDEAKILNKMVEIVSGFAKLLPEDFNGNDYSFITTYNPSYQKADGIKIPEDEQDYFYSIMYGLLKIYIKDSEATKAEEDGENEVNERQRLINENKAELESIENLSRSAVIDFIRNSTEHKLEKHSKLIIDALIKAVLDSRNVNPKRIFEVLDIDYPEDKRSWEFEYTDFEVMADKPLQLTLAILYSMFVKELTTTIEWDGQFDKNEYLNFFYGFIEKLGYKLASEEIELLDGSHRLYNKVQDEEE